PPTGWLTARAFRTRLELAAERHRRDGLAFAVHRIELAAGGAVLERAFERLPSILRDTDCICRTGPATLLLLTPHAPGAWEVVRGRILALHLEAGAALERMGEAPEPE